ncbi:MAG: neutral/alkaline non-lysosomal ceramidase N-terminal domain-containing protein [Chloroflexi bacterium]|nr:neutral/alkaline non-lysosomal ceramidase N-terminal domain-containing protein [Chloroflexota bacterium]
MLNAGVARVDISPKVGVAHAGWGAQTHQVSLGNDMPLLVTALVVTKDDVELAIVDVDIGIFTNQQDKDIRELISKESGIPFGNIRLAYTHTHSGPITFGQWIKEGIDLANEWWNTIPGACAKAVAEAKNSIQPARTGFGRGNCDVNINRRPSRDNGELFTGRNWDGFVDHSVDVVSFDDADGNPIATIVNYAMHPTIMGHENQWVTPDFPGPMRSVVEHTVGGLCLFLQGASGNQGPVDGFTGDLRVYRKAGAKLGAEASRVRLNIDPLEREERLDQILLSGADLGIYTDVPTNESDDTVAISNVPVGLPSRDVISLEDAQNAFNAAENELEKTRASDTSEEEVRRAVSKVMRANIQLSVARLSDTNSRNGYIEITAQSMRMGETVLVSIPVEPFVELADEVKKRSGSANTIFSGFSNGHINYLATDMAYEEGGYEVSVTVFAPGSAELSIGASLAAIDNVL